MSNIVSDGHLIFKLALEVVEKIKKHHNTMLVFVKAINNSDNVIITNGLDELVVDDRNLSEQKRERCKGSISSRIALDFCQVIVKRRIIMKKEKEKRK